jgi:ankyrin repeat protein
MLSATPSSSQSGFLTCAQSKIENSVRNYHQEFSESTTLDPNTKDVSDGLLPRPDANSAVLAVNSLDESKVEGRIPGVCQHKCFQHTVLSMSILDGLLGWLSLEKSVPDSRCQSCSRKNFRGSLPSLLLTYYTPWWIGHVACAIGLQANPRTSVSIYFPSLLPPDAEVFACIRSGNVERLKTLFVEQRASVADVLGPYGVSTISLAVFYGQTEVYELLHSAGADRISSMLTRSTVADVFNFWSSYSTLDYSISASDALRDHAFQTSPQHQGRALSRLSVESSLESGTFTRLHKCILKLTSESLEELLAMVETEIDETDSLGRTSLHFAVYTCSTDAVRILLDRKANPNLLDSVGKTPLQIAATMGWVDGTSLLIAHGTDIEQRYQFDNTILHNVCIQGHEHIVRLLLDAGAEMEATNGVGETCVRHAVFGNHVPVLRLLHERGAAFSSLDDLGCTAFHDSILVNSHDALEFLLGLNLRVDEKYLTTGQTALHLLAENASLPTLQIFLDKAKTGLGALEISARDAKNLTALDYLNCRRDENFKCLFSCLLKKIENVQSERSHSFFRESRVRPCTSVDFDNTEDKDKFEDALEEQPQVMI